jgi:hypothetical protein
VFPAKSLALDSIVNELVAGTVQAYVQFEVPVAGTQVLPPSTETSTCAMPPSSVAMPAMVKILPCVRDAPVEGLVITDTGRVVSETLADPPDSNTTSTQ